MSKDRRYFLGQDQSSHWYLVPANRREEFERWAAIDEEDSRGWLAPDYVTEIGCHISLLEFEIPTIPAS